MYVKPFHQHYLHQLLVHYAHKYLWQIKSHSYLMNGFSGEDGIRTHAPVKTNGFQDRPVMTTSVPLHSYLIVSHQRLDYIIITVKLCQQLFLSFFIFFQAFLKKLLMVHHFSYAYVPSSALHSWLWLFQQVLPEDLILLLTYLLIHMV